MYPFLFVYNVYNTAVNGALQKLQRGAVKWLTAPLSYHSENWVKSLNH